MTHNQQVPGSSPGWATLEINHLQNCKWFFYNGVLVISIFLSENKPSFFLL